MPLLSRRQFLLILFLGLALAQGAERALGQGGLATFERDRLTVETAGGKKLSFDVELALDSRQQAQGLMFRRSLPKNSGMLFVYKPERMVAMWMKNTLIPLDMLFIGPDGHIVRVAERAVPQSLETIAAPRPVTGVLEINGGAASRLGIQPGDRVLHPAFGTAP
jgi:uncharacterized membrane protein (UPF0127 family)